MTKAEIQLVRSLDDKRARDEAGLFVAEGEKLVREIVASGLRVRKVYFTDGDFGIGAERVTAKDMERATRLKTPANCLALVEIPQHILDPEALQTRLTLALDGVQNPGNMGTIIRLADWFGIRDILCSTDSADCWSPKVVQATMGAITRIAVHYCDLAETIGSLGINIDANRSAMTGAAAVPALPVFGTFLDGENIYEAALPATGIIVLGSEGRGISPGIERLVARRLFIPPYPADSHGSESLNVAIAAAIVCSEFRRRISTAGADGPLLKN